MGLSDNELLAQQKQLIDKIRNIIRDGQADEGASERFMQDLRENHDRLLRSTKEEIRSHTYFQKKAYEEIVCAWNNAQAELQLTKKEEMAGPSKKPVRSQQREDDDAGSVTSHDEDAMSVLAVAQRTQSVTKRGIEEEAHESRTRTNITLLEKNTSKLRALMENMGAKVRKYNFDEQLEGSSLEEVLEEAEAWLGTLKEVINKTRRDERQVPKYKDEFQTMMQPKINVPYFYGDTKDWPAFSDVYIDLVHEQENLAPGVKMHYLKTFVKGDARASIVHLLSGSSENYEAAWDLLCRRYNNKRKMFEEQLCRMMELPMLNETSNRSIERFIATINNALFIIKKQGQLEDTADSIFAVMILRKLSNEINQRYELNTKRPNEIQALEDVLSFLEQLRSSVFTNNYGIAKEAVKVSEKPEPFRGPIRSTKHCNLCKTSGHELGRCKKFLEFSVSKRNEVVRSNHACFRCLGEHSMAKCDKDWKCRTCGRNHHNLLHDHKDDSQRRNMSANTIMDNTDDDTLIATALVKVKGINGQDELLRALVDSGAQRTLVSQEAAQLLGLPRTRCETELVGVSEMSIGVATQKIRMEVRPRFPSKFVTLVDAIILPTLNKTLPSKEVKTHSNANWNNVVLADPTYNLPSRIDIIMGADMLPAIMDGCRCKMMQGLLGQQTKLGWLLSGHVKRTERKKVVATTNTISLGELQDLNRFWECDEIDDRETTTEDKACEQIYKETTTVEADGRFVVAIPFKDNAQLGDSRQQAMARFLNLEKRFKRNKDLHLKYAEFMAEYIKLGHMVSVHEIGEGRYYLPHQAVIRDASLTTKLRVVFDASAKTTNGVSLNEIMMIGPRLQKDIFDILLKWRIWPYVMTADVEKMYRQIKITPEHQKYQHILWREDPRKPITEYRLTTVTYGTASAPFLAVRTLQEIANVYCKDNTALSTVIKDDFYMDDLMTGGHDIQGCKRLVSNITQVMQRAKFHLRKWVSNDPSILGDICNETSNEVIEIEGSESIKTLGLYWDPTKDDFRFNVVVPLATKLTKRLVLSQLAKIFDPLGWLVPVTVVGKCFMQKLWLSEQKWDDELNIELSEEWRNYAKDLPKLEGIRIPRWIKVTDEQILELHGFGDASEKAYAAVIYAKVNSSVVLLTAKSKVNPIKNKKTIPKLELCAAHLVTKLLVKVKSTLKINAKTYVWSDSMITLGRIKSKKCKEKFVRNRVEDISKLLPVAEWRYVKSSENPADVGSRVIDPGKLQPYSLWWNGPLWLAESEENWPVYEEKCDNDIVVAATMASSNMFMPLLTKFSELGKMERVMAYVLRFIGSISRKATYPEYLTSDELKQARVVIIQQQQRLEFLNEIRLLRNQRQLDPKNNLLSLNPYLDENGILRVGGRLEHSKLAYNTKHPVILRKSHLATLIVRQAHKVTLHGGINVMRTYIRSNYWIIGLKRMLRDYVRACVKCIRYHQETIKQLMGNLPEYRVAVNHPFHHTGVDYAGPFQMRCSRGRGQKTFKGYIAVFVCMTTKAVHLEVVSDLSTEAFLAALRRMFARRGKAAHMYSDNGTNFVGATRKLDEDLRQAMMDNVKVLPILEAEGISWHFIPPASPHFGGIWEAGVKSVKHHLKRVIGDSNLTYEELSTLLTQIEAVLNSRPLYATGESPEDIEVLTPGHFLIGRPLLESPQPIDEGKIGALDRWRLLQRMRSDFWKKWKEEYLVELQQRAKWKTTMPNIEKGQIVLLRNEGSHPAKWPMGKVVEQHKGSDGMVRVVTIRTQDGEYKRPLNKICPLRTEEKETKAIVPDEEPIANKTRKKKAKGKMAQFMAVISLFLMIMQPVNSVRNYTKASIRDLGNTTAIYLDPVGQVDVVASSWNLVVYYDMHPFFEVLRHTEELTIDTKKLCPKLETFEKQCGTVTDNLRSHIDEIYENNRLFMISDNKRIKRAPLEFVGSFYHILFGMMDADDREAMENNMRNLLENQHKLKELAKKQTSVVDSTVNVLKRTTDEVNKHFKELREQVVNINKTMAESYYVYRESIKFFMVTKQIQAWLDEAAQIQMSIINLLIDVNHGKLNPVLIKPAQLQEEIVKIKHSLGENRILPGKRSGDELRTIYKLLEAKGVFVGQKLVISAKIPLFSSHSSQLYKVVPVPFLRASGRLIPKLSAQYIIHNFGLNAYHKISQAELNGCKEGTDQSYVCEGNWPWNDASDNSCEMSPLKPESGFNCNLDEFHSSYYWIELQTKGKWLFRLFSNSSAHIQCDDTVQQIIELPGQGILNMESGCTARIKGVTLVAPHNIQSTRYQQMQTEFIKEVDDMAMLNVKTLGPTVINNTNDIENLQNQVSELKKQNIELQGLHFHHISGHISFILIIIGLVIIIVCGVRSCVKKKKIAAITF